MYWVAMALMLVGCLILTRRVEKLEEAVRQLKAKGCLREAEKQ